MPETGVGILNSNHEWQDLITYTSTLVTCQTSYGIWYGKEVIGCANMLIKHYCTKTSWHGSLKPREGRSGKAIEIKSSFEFSAIKKTSETKINNYVLN